jgi:hypothetical protein
MIATPKSPTIGPAIPRHTRVLLGRDFGPSESVYRAMSRSAWTAAVDRRLQRHARPTGTATATQCKLAQAIAGDSTLQNQDENQRHHCSLAPWTSSPPQALTENPNGVQSSSPGLPAQRPTPGNMSHKIQPLISRDCGTREARIKTTDNSLKIQNSTLKIQRCFPRSQTISNPKSTRACPKSTVDLSCEPLIKVENSLRSSLSPTRHKPIIRPENKGIRPKSNRHRPKNFTLGRYAWWQATSVATRKHPCGVRSYVLTFLHIKSMKPIVGYCSPFQPIPAFLTPPREALPWP